MGVGLNARTTNDKTEWGIRFPAYWTFIPLGQQWDYFLELSPVMVVDPEMAADVNWTFGIRWYPLKKPTR